MRCAVLPPVPVPYRQPLFGLLAERNRIGLHVVYQSAGQPGWDQRPDWFPTVHPYPAETLAARQRSRAGRTPVVFPAGLGAALDRIDPDCVVGWEFGPASLRALAWSRRRGRRCVVFSELTPRTGDALGPARRLVHSLLSPRAAGFIAASSAGRERLLGLGVPGERIEVSLQSADVEAVRAAVERAGEHSGPPRVLAVGRLVPDKNFAALLEAFAPLAGDATLEICGAGPLERELRAHAGRLGIEVEWSGSVAPAELPDRYAAADIFVLPSLFEPFGAAIREAAGAGLPLVVSRAAGAAGDIAVQDENALLVEPTEAHALADALAALVRNPELRARLAAGSLAVTDRHPLSADAEAFERAVLAE